jgi:uncharacterized delta-60 repeat protein
MKSTMKNNQFRRKTLNSILTALFVLMIFGSFQTASAQFTFTGDYDKTFNAPLGYNIDPQFPDPTVTNSDLSSYYVSGDVMSDGSIVAGGGFYPFYTARTTFYLRKYLPSGALDTSFNAGKGFIRTDFSVIDTLSPVSTVSSRTEHMAKLKVLPDDKILVVGVCDISGFRNTGGAQSVIRGHGVCMMRFNPNGSLDTTFGTAGDFLFAPLDAPSIAANYREHPGMVWTPVGNQPMLRYPALTENLDMVVQPDGKILVAGTTRTRLQPNINAQTESGFLLRYTPQGALDTTFGNNGAIHYFSNPAQPVECTTKRRFHGVAVQPDGRIIALGSDGTVSPASNCDLIYHKNRFVVTRWTANGQLETTRYLDNITEHVGNRDEAAFRALITPDGSKVLISGTYKDLRPNPNPEIAQTTSLIRLNLSDLSLDTTFGIKQFNGCSGGNCGIAGGNFCVKTILPDGKILGIDAQNRVIRFNPNGSVDQSFGNVDAVGVPPHRGALLPQNIVLYNNANTILSAGHIIVRPNGRINLIGTAPVGFAIGRAAVSQQNTTFQSGIYSDFENDGRDNLSVFRNGNWYWLSGANNSFNAAQFGIASDKLAPADYDGDGRTDLAVFRDGAWYIIQSSNGGFRALNFGAAGDVPRPGDFDGDGLADICVFRPSDGTWYRVNSGNNQFVATQFGQNGDTPLLADFDADGKTDFAVFRAGYWYYIRSSDNQFLPIQFGSSTDIPVVGDYDGDSRADLAVFRPSNGFWYIARSSGNPSQNFDSIQFGASGDKPVPGDYDSDGKNDLAVYRNGAWYVIFSGNNSYTVINFGLAGDKPIQTAYTQP